MIDIEMCLDHPPKIGQSYWVKEDCPYCKTESLCAQVSILQTRLLAQELREKGKDEAIDRTKKWMWKHCSKIGTSIGGGEVVADLGEALSTPAPTKLAEAYRKEHEAGKVDFATREEEIRGWIKAHEAVEKLLRGEGD